MAFREHVRKMQRQGAAAQRGNDADERRKAAERQRRARDYAAAIEAEYRARAKGEKGR